MKRDADAQPELRNTHILHSHLLLDISKHTSWRGCIGKHYTRWSSTKQV